MKERRNTVRNLLVTVEYAKMINREHREEAAKNRLLRQIEARRPCVLNCLGLHIGELVIAVLIQLGGLGVQKLMNRTHGGPQALLLHARCQLLEQREREILELNETLSSSDLDDSGLVWRTIGSDIYQASALSDRLAALVQGGVGGGGAGGGIHGCRSREGQGILAKPWIPRTCSPSSRPTTRARRSKPECSRSCVPGSRLARSPPS